jgi:CheY-like chemotaxis protein
MRKVKLAYIIDDEEIITYLAGLLITQAHFSEKTEMFANGQEAINKLREIIDEDERLPDVILFDLNMPLMDGWQFVEEYQKLNLRHKVPLFVFTSSINAADRERASTYKAIKGYIQKPLTEQKLEKVLRSL